MSVPIIHVTSIPQSTSFYASVVQPLGIVYLNSSSSQSGKAQQHFGIAGTPSSETLFSLQESSKPSASTITLTASNATQVTQFHTLALSSNAGRGTNLISQTDNGSVAKTTDLDGNLLEVRYERRVRRSSNGGGSIRSGHAPRMQRQNSSDSHREGTTITTASTAKEAKRVLEWQRTVARSVSDSSNSRENSPTRAIAVRKPQLASETVVSSSTLTQKRTPPPAAPSAPSLLSQGLHQEQVQRHMEQQIPSLIRAATAPVSAMTQMYTEIQNALPTEKLESNGLSTNGLIGTIIGAAAGAAIAYAMVKSEEPESPKPPQLVNPYSAPPAYQQVPQQMARSVTQQGMQMPMPMQQPMGHDMGHNMLQAMRQHAPQPAYTEAAQYYSPSGIDVGGRSKTNSTTDSGYAGSRASRADALRYRPDGGTSQSGSRVGSLRESSHLEQMELYSSSPKSVLSASPSAHSVRSKTEGGKSSSRHATKPESPRAETVVSKHSVAKSAASTSSTSRGSEASTVKPVKSGREAATAILADAKSGYSRSGHGVGSVASGKSEKGRHGGGSSSAERARRAPVPRSEVGGYAGTVVPDDSVSQVGSRHSGHRRREEVY